MSNYERTVTLVAAGGACFVLPSCYSSPRGRRALRPAVVCGPRKCFIQKGKNSHVSLTLNIPEYVIAATKQACMDEKKKKKSEHDQNDSTRHCPGLFGLHSAAPGLARPWTHDAEEEAGHALQWYITEALGASRV